jgi:hypothetical protein
MPKQKTFADLKRDCDTFSKALVLAEKKIAFANAKNLRAGALATTRAAAPGLRLNVGKRGARIGIRYDAIGPNSYRVKATGPYQLIERDTDAHIEPRKRSGTIIRTYKRSGKTVLRKRGSTLLIPGIGFRQSAQHPGTTGKHPWARAVAAYAGTAARVAAKQVHEDLEGSFG